jgi:hypothetical protein
MLRLLISADTNVQYLLNWSSLPMGTLNERENNRLLHLCKSLGFGKSESADSILVMDNTSNAKWIITTATPGHQSKDDM